MNNFFLLAIPFFINILLATFTDYWGYKNNIVYVIFASSLVIISLFAILKFDFQHKLYQYFDNLNTSTLLHYLYGLVFLFMCIFPIRNLLYGDGIILLENSYLEGSLFGFQITLDEFLEGFLHSVWIRQFNDPSNIYRWISTGLGLLYLTLCIYLIQRMNRTLLDSLLFLATGSILLFFGYAENYTFVSLYIFFMLYLLYKWMNENKGDKFIYWIAILSAVGALFHLVFGYLGISLVYFTFKRSKKHKFIWNASVATVLAGSIISSVFIYFLFLSDPTASTTQTHIASMPFYPLRKIISTNHFIEILGNLWFTSSFAIIFILYAWINDKSKFKIFCSKPENQIIIFSLIGFLIHAIIHNPVLNYPADWDLMSFYSFPLIFLCFLYFPHISNKGLFLPILVYFIGFYISTAIVLNKNPIELESKLIQEMKIAQEYVKSNESIYKSMSPYMKKDYLKLDYFLYKSYAKLLSVKNKNSIELIQENLKYKNELENKLSENSEKFNKDWSKQYFIKLTDFHHRYLKVLEEDMKYHPETKQNSSENQ